MDLNGVLGLELLLAPSSFHRLLGLHLQILARRPRKKACPLPPAAPWPQLMQAQARDMGNLGLKAVTLHRLQGLGLHLGIETPLDDRLRALGQGMTLEAPCDAYWAERALARLRQVPGRVVWEGEARDAEGPPERVEVILRGGLTQVLDMVSGWLQRHPLAPHLLDTLVQAAASKQREAPRDLMEVVAWLWPYLATLAGPLGHLEDPCPWAQAAALVNLFPSLDPEDVPPPPLPQGGVRAEALDAALLDREPERAAFLAEALHDALGPAAILAHLAEAITHRDPADFPRAQILAVASALELLPHLRPSATRPMVQALARLTA